MLVARWARRERIGKDARSDLRKPALITTFTRHVALYYLVTNTRSFYTACSYQAAGLVGNSKPNRFAHFTNLLPLHQRHTTRAASMASSSAEQLLGLLPVIHTAVIIESVIEVGRKRFGPVPA